MSDANNASAPECDADGKYMRKQCNDEFCWCANPKNGVWLYKKQKVPLGEQYNCTSEFYMHIICTEIYIFELWTNSDD